MRMKQKWPRRSPLFLEELEGYDLLSPMMLGPDARLAAIAARAADHIVGTTGVMNFSNVQGLSTALASKTATPADLVKTATRDLTVLDHLFTEFGAKVLHLPTSPSGKSFSIYASGNMIVVHEQFLNLSWQPVPNKTVTLFKGNYGAVQAQVLATYGVSGEITGSIDLGILPTQGKIEVLSSTGIHGQLNASGSISASASLSLFGFQCGVSTRA